MDAHQRIMHRNSRPNPLFEDWIGELLTEAVEKKSRLEPMLKLAFKSIKKYPLRLNSGADCAILKGFHRKLCDFLDHRLSVYDSIINEELEEIRSANANLQDIDERGNIIHERIISSSNTPPANVPSDNINDAQGDAAQAPPRPPTPKVFMQESDSIPPNARPMLIIRPIRRSNPSDITTPLTSVQCRKIFVGSAENLTPHENTSLFIGLAQNYPPQESSHKTVDNAILFALLEHSTSNPKRGLTKMQLAKLAQKYCDQILIFPDIVTCNSSIINSNVSNLVKKGYILETRQRKIEYHMTDKGKKNILKLVKDQKAKLINNELYKFAFTSYSEFVENKGHLGKSAEEGAIHFPAGSYDIILLIDKNETSGPSNSKDPTVALFNKCPALNHEYRSLKVGDFAWIARHRDTKQELVLPYIVERKRMDDLAASIKDGRFHEQKFRLRKSGISCVIYLLEAHGKNKNLGLPLQTLKQAMANTRIQDGFKILSSSSLAQSVRLLSMLTNKIISDYKIKTLKGRNGPPGMDELHTYQYFSGMVAKNKSLTVNGMFLKQLLQMKGLSVDKALCISNKYPTPSLLVEEYRKLPQNKGEMLLANLKFGDTLRCVGRIISKAVYDLFTRRIEE